MYDGTDPAKNKRNRRKLTQALLILRTLEQDSVAPNPKDTIIRLIEGLTNTYQYIITRQDEIIERVSRMRNKSQGVTNEINSR